MSLCRQHECGGGVTSKTRLFCEVRASRIFVTSFSDSCAVIALERDRSNLFHHVVEVMYNTRVMRKGAKTLSIMKLICIGAIFYSFLITTSTVHNGCSFHSRVCSVGIFTQSHLIPFKFNTWVCEYNLANKRAREYIVRLLLHPLSRLSAGQVLILPISIWFHTKTIPFTLFHISPDHTTYCVRQSEQFVRRDQPFWNGKFALQI